MDRVKDLPHTADIGFVVEAHSLNRLFELAARGLVSALGTEPATEAAEPETPERLQLRRPDLDRLLVAWLRELLHHATDDRLVPARARATVTRGSDQVELHAEILWGRWSDEHPPAREIKGVTYHGLHVEERGGSWHAQVFLDV